MRFLHDSGLFSSGFRGFFDRDGLEMDCLPIFMGDLWVIDADSLNIFPLTISGSETEAFLRKELRRVEGSGRRGAEDR